MSGSGRIFRACGWHETVTSTATPDENGEYPLFTSEMADKLADAWFSPPYRSLASVSISQETAAYPTLNVKLQGATNEIFAAMSEAIGRQLRDWGEARVIIDDGLVLFKHGESIRAATSQEFYERLVAAGYEIDITDRYGRVTPPDDILCKVLAEDVMPQRSYLDHDPTKHPRRRRRGSFKKGRRNGR